VPPLQYAVAGFSDLVLTVDFDLLEVLEVWNRMPTVEPYIKLDITRYISIISKLRENGFRLTKEQELRAANIPFDETEDELYRLFFSFLRVVRRGEPLARPLLPEKRATQYTLPELEQHCRKLDLYFSFSKAFYCEIDQDELYEERELIAEQINRILLHNLKNNIRFCKECDAALPLHHNGRLCAACYAKRRSRSKSVNQ
jgi:ATP-dependent RNA helicase SUPV3L1/SUV3